MVIGDWGYIQTTITKKTNVQNVPKITTNVQTTTTKSTNVQNIVKKQIYKMYQKLLMFKQK